MLRLWSCVPIARRCGSAGEPYADAHDGLTANGFRSHQPQIAQSVEHQPHKLSAEGSTPSLQPLDCAILEQDERWSTPCNGANTLRTLGFALARRNGLDSLSC